MVISTNRNLAYAQPNSITCLLLFTAAVSHQYTLYQHSRPLLWIHRHGDNLLAENDSSIHGKLYIYSDKLAKMSRTTPVISYIHSLMANAGTIHRLHKTVIILCQMYYCFKCWSLISSLHKISLAVMNDTILHQEVCRLSTTTRQKTNFSLLVKEVPLTLLLSMYHSIVFVGWRTYVHHLLYGSLGSFDSAPLPPTASQQVQPFLHSSLVWPTQTDRHKHIYAKHIYALLVTQAMCFY